MSDIRFEGWLHKTGTGGVYQDAAGNVGIASTQPKTRLDIQNGAFQIGPAGICTATTVNTTNLVNATQLSHRNIIINGAMRVNQRATSSTTSGMQTVDRFLCQFGGTDEALTQAQGSIGTSDIGPFEEGFIKSFKITNGNQTSGAGAADYVEIYTALEDQDISSSGWNYKSSSSYITISFWVKSSVAQKFPGFLYTNQAGAGDSFMYSYQIDNGSGGNLSANTWTKITHSIPGNSSLSFNNDNTRGLSVAIFPFNGTDTSTSDHTDGAWAAWSTSNKIKDMTSTWYTTNDATFEITGVQLEVGSVATPFEHRNFADDTQLCRRYFQVNGATSGDHMMWGWGRAEGNSARVAIPVPVPMRAAPTVAATANRSFKYDGTAVQSTQTPSLFGSGAWVSHASSYTVDFPSGGSLSHNNAYIVTSDSGSKLTMDAEF